MFGEAIALILAAVVVEGQSQSPEPPATVLEEIVVEGRLLRDAVEQFVDEIVAPPVGRGPARWNRPVCVGVVNLRNEMAQALADQVSLVAVQAGLDIGEPGCDPNVLIIATDDGPGLARALVAGRPRVFRPQYAGAARSVEALERFQETAAPVRWWHVSVPMLRDTNMPGVRMPGGNPPIIPGAGMLRTTLRNDLLKAFIIVDLDDAEGIDIGRLGDYVGMVALAQIDPQAETAGYDTILNLFDDARSPASLTAWDMSYLGALYGSELNQRAANQQGGEVSGRMFRDRRSAMASGSD